MTPPKKRPNILLISTDQQRWDGLALNRPGTALRTPTLDSLAAGGLNCTRAYSTCPVCIPARRTLLSGLHPRTHGLRGYQDGLEWEAPVSLPGILGSHGYQTQLIGKLHLHPQRKRYGYDHMVRTEGMNDRWDTPLQPVNDWADDLKERGITQQPNNLGISGNGRVGRPFDLPEQFHHSSWLADRAVDFLVKYRDPSTPYFLHLSFIAPHPPLIPPQAYWDQYANHGDRPVFSDWTPNLSANLGLPDDSATGPFREEEIAEAIRGYYGLITHVDHRIRHVLTRAFEYGSPRQSEPTLIIFTSDHGEMLGDHHLFRKSLPYEASARVPFFIAWKNMDLQSGVFDGLVSLEDVSATVLDLCDFPLPEQYDNERESRSLAPALRGEPCHTRDRLYGECTGGTHNNFIIEGPWKYVWFAKTHEEQLFNVLEDPTDRHDCSGSNADQLPRFRALLANYLKDDSFSPERCTPCKNRPPRALWGDHFQAPEVSPV